MGCGAIGSTLDFDSGNLGSNPSIPSKRKVVMKITEMRDEDIVALTEEQLDMLIKIECMEQGVPLEPLPPELNCFELPKGSLAYKVKGTEFWFEDRADAENIAKAIQAVAHKRRQQKYDWRTGYDIEWLENYEQDVGVEEKTFYDKLQVQDKEAFLAKRKTLKEQYEADKKKYETSREKVRKVSDQIYSVYYEARKENERVKRYKSMFQEYLSMAEGNHNKARMFFDKAYASDLSQELYSKIFPGETINEYAQAAQ